MAIIWRDEMKVDSGTIDDDHRVLFAIINEFGAADITVSGPQCLSTILEELSTYTKAHFTREERLQTAALYPYFEAHHREHQDLIKRLVALQEKMQTAGDDEDAVKLVQRQIGVLLHDWLINHIIKSDLRMRPYAGTIARHVPNVSPALKRNVIPIFPANR